MRYVYKLVAREHWPSPRRSTVFEGAAIDLKDGYIHLSTALQVAETARRHFVGVKRLMLLSFEIETLGPALRWEASRAGDLFPHLYAPLPIDLVRYGWPISLDSEGVPQIPSDLPL